MAKAHIGPISEGTLKTDDLVFCFVDLLEDIDHEALERILKNYPDFSNGADDDCDEEFFESEEAAYLLEQLEEALDAVAPPFCSFGAHPGDGACFGFWPQHPDEITDFNPEVIKVKDVPEYLLQVNEHGNVTLYKVTVQEEWSVV